MDWYVDNKGHFFVAFVPVITLGSINYVLANTDQQPSLFEKGQQNIADSLRMTVILSPSI